jgi:hypothetical protein
MAGVARESFARAEQTDATAPTVIKYIAKVQMGRMPNFRQHWVNNFANIYEFLPRIICAVCVHCTTRRVNIPSFSPYGGFFISSKSEMQVLRQAQDDMGIGFCC